MMNIWDSKHCSYLQMQRWFMVFRADILGKERIELQWCHCKLKLVVWHLPIPEWCLLLPINLPTNSHSWSQFKCSVYWGEKKQITCWFRLWPDMLRLVHVIHKKSLHCCSIKTFHLVSSKIDVQSQFIEIEIEELNPMCAPEHPKRHVRRAKPPFLS